MRPASPGASPRGAAQGVDCAGACEASRRRSRVIESPAVYEVRCPSCNVSFPPEAKVCVHCGARLSRASVARAPARRARAAEPGASAGAAEAARPPGSADLEMEEDLEELQRGGLLRTGVGAVWILLALVATCYRVCSGG